MASPGKGWLHSDVPRASWELQFSLSESPFFSPLSGLLWATGI